MTRVATRTSIRRRLVALSSLCALVVAGVIALTVGGSTSVGPPASAAATVVPSSALAYAHVSLDLRRSSVTRALRLASRIPDYATWLAAVQGRLASSIGIDGAPAFAVAVRPWIGDEAAFAVLDTPGTSAGTLTVLAVRDLAASQRFLTRSGAQADGSARGVPLLRFPGGTSVAIVKHFLVIGQRDSVRAAIDVAAGARPSLAGSAEYRRTAADEPADRVLDAYAPAGGLRRLTRGRAGALQALVDLVQQPALSAVSLSLSPSGNGARLVVHASLSPSLAGVGAARSPSFDPALGAVVPSGSMVMLEVGRLDKVAPGLLTAGGAAGFGGGLAPLLSRLGSALSSEGVDVPSVLDLFDGQSAVAITKQDGKSAVLIVARVRDEAVARRRLAALEVPLQGLFPPAGSGSGQAPIFDDRRVGGVTIHALALAPGLTLNYAVFDKLVVVSTGADAITQVAARGRALRGDDLYRSVLGAGTGKVTSLLFLDFSQLLSLAQQTGLTRGASFEALAPDLNRIRAAGLRSVSGKNDSTAELFLQIQ